MKKFFTKHFKKGTYIFLVASMFLTGFLASPTVTHAGACDLGISVPTFNQYPVVLTNDAGCIYGNSAGTEFPIISGNVHGAGFWASNFNAQIGDSLTFKVYMNNSADEFSGAVMHNVSYATAVSDSANGTSHTLTTTLTASNAVNSGVQGSVVVNTPTHTHLDVTSGNLSDFVGDMNPYFSPNDKFFYITMVVVADVPVVLPTATVSLTANGSHNITVPAGTTIVYDWSTTNASSTNTTLQIFNTATNTPVASDACGITSGAVNFFPGTDGNLLHAPANCQVGYTYVFTDTPVNGAGIDGTPDTLTVVVANPAVVVPPPTPVVTGSLTSNGSHNITVPAGTNIAYVWSTTNASTTVTLLKIYNNATGGNLVSSDGCPVPNLSISVVGYFPGIGGTTSATTLPCQVGYTYVFTFVPYGPTGVPGTLDSVTVTVANPAVIPPVLVATANILANGLHAITVPANTLINYIWSSTNSDTGSTTLQISNSVTHANILNDSCLNSSGVHTNTSGPFSLFSGIGGNTSATTQQCQVGYTYDFTYTTANANGQSVPSHTTITVTAPNVIIVPTGTLTANGLHTISVPANTLINYVWSTTNATSSITTLQIYNTATNATTTTDACPAANVSGPVTYFPGIGGTISATTLPCQVGYTYVYTFVGIDANGVSSAVDTTTIIVTAPAGGGGGGNTPPTITVVGANPYPLTQGQVWNDPGATANDLEDGNLTTHITKTGNVDTATVGSYVITYNVIDSGGLTASRTRTVVVSPPSGGGGGSPSTGTVTFCLVLADQNNLIATSSFGLPTGTFNLGMGNTTAVASSSPILLNTVSWTSGTFTPNKKTILSLNDSHCITYNALPFGNYYYSPVVTTGSAYQTTKYNDQFNQPVNGLSDFFAYSPELFNGTTTDDAGRNFGSDGMVTLNSVNTAPIVYILQRYDSSVASSSHTLVITSPLTASGVTGTPFTYQITAVSSATTSITYSIGTSTLPAGLTFAGATISGTPTVAGTYPVQMYANDGISTTTATLVITITAPSVAPSGGGGGGGGGGNGPIVGSFNGGGGGNGSNIPLVYYTVPAPTAPAVNPGACEYLHDYLHIGWNNNPVEVNKLQIFLRDLEGYSNVQITGVYDAQTVTAVDAFQSRYSTDILIPWGDVVPAPSDFTYILTKKKVNEIYCKTAFPVTVQEQSVIDAYRNFIQDLGTHGVEVTPNEGQTGISSTTPVIGPHEIGMATTTTGAGVVTQPNNPSFLAQTGSIARSAFSGLANVASVSIAFPWKWIRGVFVPNQCALGSATCGFIDGMLVTLIGAVIYIWFMAKKNALDTINKELDLK